ncbi:MAG: fused MFS/spermidine synthase [Bryobacteraceae bacterium]|jgi:spermidine synthase
MAQVSTVASAAGAPRRFIPALVILFAASGCSALIYEIVWYQLLQLVIGSTAVSLGVLLATFMGGLCLGSIGFPRWLSPRRHPLRVYAALEAGIGVCGVLVLLGMPSIGGLYSSAVGHGFPSILLRAVVCAVCLLPPTALMGASLPAAARWVERSPNGVPWMGLLYGANTAGAVFGCLLAGFYLLRVGDMATATFVAAGINAAVALTSFLLARFSPHECADQTPAPETAGARGYWTVYVAIGLSGAAALGAEVVWTRLLGLMLGGTVYTFSIILGIFLAGLGIGSAVASAMLRGNTRPRLALGVCQALLAAMIAWTAWMLADSLPYWPINPFLSTSLLYTFQLDIVRCLWAILPATLLWGASFPFALAAASGAATGSGRDAGRLVGRIYAANTFGAILGALTFSMILIPWMGTRRSESALIGTAAAGGLVVLAPMAWRARSKTGAALLAAAACAAVFLAAHVDGVPGELIAYGRRITISRGSSEVLYTAEGMNASIAITRWNDGAVQFHVSGKVEASTEPYDMRLQRMLGHLPALLHPQPRSVLVVGFGAGVTSGTFVLYPSIRRIVICEMEKIIPPTAQKYFHSEHYDVLDDPRTQVVYDDARHYVLTTPETFDIITSDPIHPFVKGSATLYSRDYFEMVKRKLNPGGVVTQWVPLYETDEHTVKSEIATFFQVFPNGTIWANELNGGGYDLVLMGRKDPAAIDVDAMQNRLDQPAYARVGQSLLDVGFSSAFGLLGTYAGRASDLKPWLEGAEINRDGNLRLQYLAGLALNDSQEGTIYARMLQFRVYPQDLFVVSPQRQPDLMRAFEAHGE